MQNAGISLLLAHQGLKAAHEGLSIAVRDAGPNEILGALGRIGEDCPITPEGLASSVANKMRGKWDLLLPDGLLDRNFASLYLDWEGGLALPKAMASFGGQL